MTENSYFDDVNPVEWPKSGTRIYNEIPSGDIDGSNTEFALDFPYESGTLVIYHIFTISGITYSRRLILADFSEVDEITFELNIDPPSGSDELICDYNVD